MRVGSPGDGGGRRALGAAAALALLVAPAAVPAQTAGFLSRPDPAIARVTPQAAPGDASAALGPGADALRARQAMLLERTRRDPTDYEAAYAYVEVSNRLRDSEAAIGTLERLINYNPGLVRANYELGLLYYGLGSYDAAARYLAIASGAAATEPALAARAAALYADAAKQGGRSRWSGFVQAGLRYQSNATFIPAGGAVRLNGQDFLLAPADRRRRADGSGFGLVQLGHDYDLENQRGDVLETRFLAFGSGQFDVSSFDFGYVEASFGPRFGLPELAPGASIKPYVVGQSSALRAEGLPYLSSGGGGVTLRLPAFDAVTFDLGVEGRALSVAGRDPLAAATLNDGRTVSGYLVATAGLGEGVDLEVRAVGLRAEAGRGGQSFVRGGGAVALGFQIDPPSELMPRKWKLSPFASAAVLEFDRANPAIDPRVARRDTEVSVGLVLDAPLTAWLGLTALVSYDRIDSNLPNYRQRGVTVLGGPTARF
jgi:hypothetical protein